MVVVSEILWSFNFTEREFMIWTCVIVRNNIVEHCKSFKDYWEGSEYADNFIKRVEPSLTFYPAYNRDEYYKSGDLSVGLYKSE